MDAPRNFRSGGGGGGGKPKKGPHHGVKSSRTGPHGEKAPHNEKSVAKRPPY